MLVEFLLKHKGHGSEQAGLRQACLSPKWDDTNPSATAPWSRASSPRPVIATRPIGEIWPAFGSFEDTEVAMGGINCAGKGGGRGGVQQGDL